MLRAAAFTLRHLRTPRLTGVRRLCSNSYPDCYFYSETEAREIFEMWCKKYGKTYPSEDEKLLRFGRFRGTLERCHGENQKRGEGAERIFEPYETADETLGEYGSRAGGMLFPLPRGPTL